MTAFEVEVSVKRTIGLDETTLVLGRCLVMADTKEEAGLKVGTGIVVEATEAKTDILRVGGML